jgi:hypothetical protein
MKMDTKLRLKLIINSAYIIIIKYSYFINHNLYKRRESIMSLIMNIFKYYTNIYLPLFILNCADLLINSISLNLSLFSLYLLFKVINLTFNFSYLNVSPILLTFLVYLKLKHRLFHDLEPLICPCLILI